MYDILLVHSDIGVRSKGVELVIYCMTIS